MKDLSSNWTNDYSSERGGGMSAALIYLGLIALSGTYLIKDSIHCLFLMFRFCFSNAKRRNQIIGH